MKRITVVAAHPDDETLGCGGTILRHIADGVQVSWVIVTSAWEPMFDRVTIDAKAREVERVANAYGLADVRRLALPTTRLRDSPMSSVVDALAPVLDELRPDWLYTVHGGDVHSDHRVVFEALNVIFKPFRTARRLKRFLSFETLSSTDAAPSAFGAFQPNVFVDVTPYIERKIEIMQLFESERQPYPLPRAPESIRALARHRGATIGCGYAEAFMLIREIADEIA